MSPSAARSPTPLLDLEVPDEAGPSLLLLPPTRTLLPFPATPDMEDARRVLHHHWGHADFRPGQADALRAVLDGRDVLAVLPTGAGKSIVYQVPALLRPGLTVVVSPLISLMKDQIDGLLKRDVPCAFINSSLSPRAADERLCAAEEGSLKLLYVAPERFDSIGFRERIRHLAVSLLAIDEAHCVSHWGHDFRPAYMRLGQQRELLGNPQVLALTATATPQVRRDIIGLLGLSHPAVIVTSFDRPNLAWRVERAPSQEAKARMLAAELRGLGEGSAVVYASTRSAVDGLTESLRHQGHDAVAYHGGQDAGDRRHAQEVFMAGRARVVVATCAFGMGVDKPDVRKVVHVNFPGTIEAYYQEAGRAGRDGKPSECVLLFDEADEHFHLQLLETSHPHPHVYREVYQGLLAYLDAERRLTITGAELARRLGWGGFNPISHCLGVFHRAGIVHHTNVRSAGIFLTLQRPPEEIKAILAPEKCADEREILREIWRMLGKDALYRGTLLSARQIESIQGERKAVRKALAKLEKRGILTHVAGEHGTVVLQTDDLDPDRLPLPWKELEERRRVEFGKLQRVIDYAKCEGCRRGFLLEYFGDPEALPRCRACDRCAPRVGVANATAHS